jgi:hypothetical protein
LISDYSLLYGTSHVSPPFSTHDNYLLGFLF